MNCEYCHKPTHVWFECKDKPDGWKPERLKKTGRGTKGPEKQQQVQAASPVQVGSAISKTSYTAFLPPVNSESSGPNVGLEVTPPSRAKASVAQRQGKQIIAEDAGSTPAAGAKFDKKAWMREYMREYMRDRRSKKKQMKEAM